jgi:hypothetical protein
MSVSFFQIPDTLIGNVPQTAARGQKTQMCNWILEHPTPKVPETNSTLDQTQIDLLMTAIDTHYLSMTEVANIWQNGDAEKGQSAVNDVVIDIMNSFIRFVREFSKEYKKLTEAAYSKDESIVSDKLTRIQRLLETVINTSKGSVTAVKNYEDDLAEVQDDFNKDYDRVITEVGKVSEIITGLKECIDDLQENISENNSEVLNTFLDTSGKDIEQGVVMFTSAETGDLGGVVSAGVQMGVAYVEGLEKTIQLNEKTLDDILKIRKLSMQVNEDEVILTALVNIGTMLMTLGGKQGIKLNIISDIVDYWNAMASGIASLLENHPDNLSGQIDTIGFSPETEKYKDPAFPPWNVILPLKKASTAFEKLLDLEPQTFGNDTKFKALK